MRISSADQCSCFGVSCSIPGSKVEGRPDLTVVDGPARHFRLPPAESRLATVEHQKTMVGVGPVLLPEHRKYALEASAHVFFRYIVPALRHPLGDTAQAKLDRVQKDQDDGDAPTRTPGCCYVARQAGTGRVDSITRDSPALPRRQRARRELTTCADGTRGPDHAAPSRTRCRQRRGRAKRLVAGVELGESGFPQPLGPPTTTSPGRHKTPHAAPVCLGPRASRSWPDIRRGSRVSRRWRGFGSDFESVGLQQTVGWRLHHQTLQSLQREALRTEVKVRHLA